MKKFRAWDENNRCMWSWEEIQEMWETEGYSDSIFREDHWQCLQYTGLKDKNSVEIYEGDIVESHIFGICEVRYYQNAFVLWASGGDFTRGANYLHESCTIIGNIYENPELLEKDKA